MLAIIISACLVTDPGVCKDYSIPLELDVDHMTCAMYAPAHFGQWADEHPGWTIRKWQCSSKQSKNI